MQFKRCRHHGTMLLLILVLCVVSACTGSWSQGTIPRGTPDYGSGTPAQVPGSADQVAFVRNDQLFISADKEYIQVTQFDFSQLPTVFWQTPLWSPDGQYLAFIVSAHSEGVGGGGCPGPDYSAGGVYVMDRTTKQMNRVLLPELKKILESENIDLQKRPPHDYWSMIFWEDVTHLLAWYDGDGTEDDHANIGLYRYDLQTMTLEQVIGYDELLVNQKQESEPEVLAIRYRSGYLFYTVLTTEGNASRIAIVRHALQQSQQSNDFVWDLGTESKWCGEGQERGPYVFPGWDVSPDGQQVVAQTLDGKIQVQRIEDGNISTLFQQLPVELLQRDVVLSWGPDNQTVVLSEPQNVGDSVVRGPYSTKVSQPEQIQEYQPNLAGTVTWKQDGSAFALQQETVGTTGQTLYTVYRFSQNSPKGEMLINDAHEFSWG